MGRDEQRIRGGAVKPLRRRPETCACLRRGREERAAFQLALQCCAQVAVRRQTLATSLVEALGSGVAAPRRPAARRDAPSS